MSSLPASWVEKLFSRLSGIYGTAFTNKFANGKQDRSGKDIGLENAKHVWAEELAGFADMPEAIAKALADLDPDFAPSSRKFLELCRDAAKTIRNDRKALSYTPTPEEEERARLAAKKAKEAVQARAGKGMKQWALDLRAEYLAGHQLSAIQQKFASEALGEVWMNGKCNEKLATA
jgi:hypothetical protein